MLHDLIYGTGSHIVLSARVGSPLLSWLIMARIVQALVFESLAIVLVYRYMRGTMALPGVIVWSMAAFLEAMMLTQGVQLWTLFEPAFVLRNYVNTIAAGLGLVALMMIVLTPVRDLTKWWRHQCKGMISTINMMRDAAGKPPVDMPVPPGVDDDE